MFYFKSVINFYHVPNTTRVLLKYNVFNRRRYKKKLRKKINLLNEKGSWNTTYFQLNDKVLQITQNNCGFKFKPKIKNSKRNNTKQTKNPRTCLRLM